MPKSLKLAKAQSMKSARSAHALWTSVSNDEFFPMQMYYSAFYESRLDQYDKSEEGGAKVRRLGEELEHLVNWFNTEVWWDTLGISHDSKNMRPVSTVPSVAKRLSELEGQNEPTRRLMLRMLQELDARVYVEKSDVNAILTFG